MRRVFSSLRSRCAWPAARHAARAGISLAALPLASCSHRQLARSAPLAAVFVPARSLCASVVSARGGGTIEAAPLVGAVSDEPAVRGASPNAFLTWESPEYARFVNIIMMSGKKEVARKLLWRAFVRLRDGGHDPQDVFYGALENVRPMMEMRTFKSGPVPFPLNPRRAEGQAMKWIRDAARKRTGQSLDVGLAAELLAAHQYKGSAIQKKEDVHKAAVANQAAAHFRWRAGNSKTPGSIDLDRKEYRPRGRRANKRLQGVMSEQPPPRPSAPDRGVQAI